jgi:hypothetical protein
MGLIMFRATVKPGAMEDLEAAAKRTFAAIGEAAPDEVRYTALRVAGGDEVVGLLEVEDREANPLSAVPEFVEWQQVVQASIAGPPEITALEPLGSYRLV